MEETEFDDDEHLPAPIRTDKQRKKLILSVKPIVLKHPYSGKKSLYTALHILRLK